MLPLLLLACSATPSDSAAPVSWGDELGRLSIPPAHGLWLDGGRALACAGDDGLYVLDISAVQAPMEQDHVDVPCLDIAGDSGRVFVAAGDAGLQVLHAGNLSVVGEHDAGAPVDALWVDGGERQAWLAGADPADGALVVSGVATWSSEALAENARVSLDAGDAVALAWDRETLVVARTDGLLQTIDTLGLEPAALGSIDLGAPALAGSLVLHEERLWVPLGDAGLASVDLTDPAAPVVAWSTDTPAFAVAPVGDVLHVGTTDGLVLYDLADLDAPAEQARVDIEDLPAPRDIVVEDGVAHVVDGHSGAYVAVSLDGDPPE